MSTASGPVAARAAATGRLDPIADFVDAMSAHAGAVVLVTCRVDGRPWGMTVTAFVSVSAHPPTVLASLGSETTAAKAIAVAHCFGASVLAEEQVALARLGSARGAAKFLDRFVEAEDRGSATPAVAGAVAHLDCEVAEVVRVADHTLFIGRVVAAQSPHRRSPLLYHRRTYRAVGARAAGGSPTERTLRCLSS